MDYIKGEEGGMDIDSFLWFNHKHMDEKMNACMK